MRLNHYSEQCGRGIKRKHYPIQYGKGVEKDTEEDTDSDKSDDTLALCYPNLFSTCSYYSLPESQPRNNTNMAPLYLASNNFLSL